MLDGRRRRMLTSSIMKRLLMLLVLFPAAATCAQLKAGDVAPDFAAPSSTGKTVRLADFKGKRAVVLAFFPKAFTSG